MHIEDIFLHINLRFIQDAWMYKNPDADFLSFKKKTIDGFMICIVDWGAQSLLQENKVLNERGS